MENSPFFHAIPVRYEECDPYGHVNHSNYLRYTQAATFQALANLGHPLQTGRDMARAWWVRDTEIDYKSPLRYGDLVNIKLEITACRRVRFRCRYEMRCAVDDRLVANAATDWVHMDADCSKPVAIPPSLVGALRSGISPGNRTSEPGPAQRRFPTPPPPPAGLFEEQRRVEWSDLDPAGHVSNAVYLSYMEECAIRDCLSRGWTMERMLTEGGFAIVARHYRIQYLQPAMPADRLTVSTWISDVRRVTAVRHFAVARQGDGMLLARATSRWAWIDPETGRPLRIPPAFIADMSDNVVDGS